MSGADERKTTYDTRQARRGGHAELRRKRAQVARDVHGRVQRDDVLRDDACVDERKRASAVRRVSGDLDVTYCRPSSPTAA